MNARLLAIAALSVFAAGPMAAQDLQNSPCPAGTGPLDARTISQDACNQAYDVFQFMAPQLGLALAGGNATLGKGSTLGGLGHFSVGLRGNVFSGLLPDVGNFQQSTTGAQRRALPTKTQVIGLPTADAALGIFKGIPLGLTNVGGIDVLASAAYVPTVSANNVSVTPKQNWQFGFGGRLGILEESLLVPGVSVSYLERDLPTTSIAGTSGSNSLQVNNMSVKTTAWRLTASKSFIVFGLALGYGQDKYSESADISATVTQNGFSGSQTVPGTSQSLTRSNMFADVSLNLPLFKLVGEVGQVSGGSVATYNSFSGGRADRSIQYGSVGLRLAW